MANEETNAKMDISPSPKRGSPEQKASNWSRAKEHLNRAKSTVKALKHTREYYDRKLEAALEELGVAQVHETEARHELTGEMYPADPPARQNAEAATQRCTAEDIGIGPV